MPHRSDWKGTVLKEKKKFYFPGSLPTTQLSHCATVGLHGDPKSCCIETSREVTRESKYRLQWFRDVIICRHCK